MKTTFPYLDKQGGVRRDGGRRSGGSVGEAGRQQQAAAALLAHAQQTLVDTWQSQNQLSENVKMCVCETLLLLQQYLRVLAGRRP